MTGPALTIWHNTRCPVCDAGIRFQKSRLATALKAGRIVFSDINLEPDALGAYGASLEDIRRRLHAVDSGGSLLVGADVAVAIWRETPGHAWLARLFGNRLLLPVTRLAYDSFAALLYHWNRSRGHW